MKETKYTIRYISRIVLEAETPLAVGMGEKSLLTDALVVTDINGLPFIPGTSLAGVIRSACGIKQDDHTPFGYQDGTEAEGSKVIFSDGVMIGSDGNPVDGLRVIGSNDPFYSHFKTLPVRQHVCINSKGSTDKGGLFNEQVAYKGMRFCFEMELLSTGSDEERDFYQKMLDTLCSSTFRIGSGTRNGFGSMKIVSLYRRDYDLTNASDLESYISRSASLDRPLELKGAIKTNTKQNIDSKWHRYVLQLQPVDFFLFSSGLSDDEADFTPVKEPFIEWENGMPQFSEHGILIPASSIKGAIAHRTAYHWNKLEGRFADQDGTNPLTGDDNPAVVAIFGRSGQGKDEEIQRGNIMLSDVFIPAASNRRTDEKILNHVAIDRFTGGAIDGALFTEKVINGRGRVIELNIDVLSESISNAHVRKAFEASLQDIADGLLPLGGGVNRGNGMFKGTLTGKIE